MSSRLQKLIETASEFQKLMPYAQFSITDKEKYIHATPGEDFFLDSFSAGHTFLDGSIAAETIATGKVVTRMGNKALTGGIPYQGTCVPIYEDGQLVGSSCVFYATTNREAVLEMSEDIGATVEELHATIETFRSSMQALRNGAKVMEEDSMKMGDASARINAVTDFVAGVSSQTKLLGLNAGIEATRAHEYGTGFAVVAKEIKRLSESVTDSVSEIKDTTDHLERSLDKVQGQISDVFNRIQDGYTATETFLSVSEQLVQLTERLQELSQVIKI